VRMGSSAAKGSAVAVVALLMLMGCGEAGPEPDGFEPLVSFDTIAVEITTADDTIGITAELADTGDRRSYGLMERSDLADDHGMLFVYPETLEPTGQFWMYRTLVRLDIAFLDPDGTIVAIMAMDPCPSPNPDVCRRYSPGIPYQGALEVRQGFFEARGVATGDRVTPAPADVPAMP
jgi:uncharacterized protein